MSSKLNKTILSIALLLVLSFSFLHAEEAKKEVELLPEVKALIEKQETLPDNFYENNLFIGLLGVFYPEDNFYEVATEIFKHNYPRFSKAIENPTLSSDDLGIVRLQKNLKKGSVLLDWSKKFNQVYELETCFFYSLENCVEKTLKKRTYLQKLFNTNKILVDRYYFLATKMQSHSDHIAWMKYYGATMGAYYDVANGYYGIQNFVTLMSNQAVLNFADNKVEAGIENLRVARSMLSMILESNRSTSLIPLSDTIDNEQVIDQFIDGLLSSRYLENHLMDVRIEKLVTPYPEKYEKSIASTIILEQEYGLKFTLMGKVGSINYNDINRTYQLRTRYLDAYNGGHLYGELKEIIESCHSIEEYCYLFSLSISDDLKKYYLQRNYHNLVYLKFIILRDKVADKDILKFLESQGDIAKDPITKKTFVWDQNNRTISTPINDSRNLPATIHSAMNRKILKESIVIEDLQVIIPKR